MAERTGSDGPREPRLGPGLQTPLDLTRVPPPAAAHAGSRRLSVRAKLILGITLPLIIVVGLVSWLNFASRKAEAFAETETRVSLLVRDYAGRLDGQFETAAQVARSTAGFLALSGAVTEQQLYEALEANLAQNPLIYGSCIAFEPGVFQGKQRFAPYVHRDGAGTRRIDIGADAYDYLDWPWYARPRTARAPMWTEPYFDEGAGNILMCTYSAPVLVNGTVRGVATIDIPIPNLNAYLTPPELDGADFAIVSAKGTFIASPRAEANGTETIFQFATQYQRPELHALAADFALLIPALREPSPLHPFSSAPLPVATPRAAAAMRKVSFDIGGDS